MPSSETICWADGLLLVYAITDRRSFNFVRRVKQNLCCDTPLALVANKGDMVHLRQVSTEEGKLTHWLSVVTLKGPGFDYLSIFLS